MSVDFLATREGCEPQAQCCARLITEIIVQALRDLGVKPSTIEKETMRNVDDDARAAARFFFDKDSFFHAYAKLIGMDGERFAEAIRLNSVSYPHLGVYMHLARVARIRHQWWLNEQANPLRRAA